MYFLHVHYPGDLTPKAIFPVMRGADALSLIPTLLQEHEGCETIRVHLDQALLFSVDCKGNRVDATVMAQSAPKPFQEPDW